jgi:S-adenosylmethionine/arginine decarboxylase-like enzyme
MNGITLLININSASQDILSSEETIRLFLIRAVEAANMTPVRHTMQMVHFPISINKVLKGGYGISAGVILVESHIYFHGWTEESYARIELSSCKQFDIQSVVNIVKTFFGREVEIEYRVIPWAKGGFYESNN